MRYGHSCARRYISLAQNASGERCFWLTDCNAKIVSEHLPTCAPHIGDGIDCLLCIVNEQTYRASRAPIKLWSMLRLSSCAFDEAVTVFFVRVSQGVEPSGPERICGLYDGNSVAVDCNHSLRHIFAACLLLATSHEHRAAPRKPCHTEKTVYGKDLLPVTLNAGGFHDQLRSPTYSFPGSATGAQVSSTLAQYEETGAGTRSCQTALQ